MKILTFLSLFLSSLTLITTKSLAQTEEIKPFDGLIKLSVGPVNINNEKIGTFVIISSKENMGNTYFDKRSDLTIRFLDGKLKEFNKNIGGHRFTAEMKNIFRSKTDIYSIGEVLDNKFLLGKYTVFGKLNDKSVEVTTEVEEDLLPLGTNRFSASGFNCKIKLFWRPVEDANLYFVNVYQGGRFERNLFETFTDQLSLIHNDCVSNDTRSNVVAKLLAINLGDINIDFEQIPQIIRASFTEVDVDRDITFLY